ncbi:acyltransferase ChoActase/COT/CPT [Macrolepiota fuliginosa MF-IS2]|uniref:Carnitine O-acetyltransferase, mitochondrial n=1 Tax=Macrolepiota fuliginosa MF-IS2 TaxID=1400762 RepID=A0A9P5X2X2_9AGAR|nr:acyltransferase ChoActase/COT/CPT [Macrolepiota fuliginosa MF-IS2]
MARSSSTAPPPQDPPPGYAIDPSAPPMLRYQASVPTLPVPTLQSTCAKYLETVQPLLTPDAFARTQKVVGGFLASPQAAQLQKRLQDRAAEPGMKNWLADWWNDVSYMGYRDPVIVYVSYFFVHVDDRFRRHQATRAASLVKAMLPFRELVESGRLEPDKIKGAPLCMASYKWLFHSSRYPVKPSDIAQKFDHKENNHIAVVRKNKFFIVPLADPSGRELSAAELELQFKRIIATAGETPDAYPVGALTGDNRDLWADARPALLAASPDGTNEALLRKIESAMIVIALDDTKPVTREDISWGAWVGDGRNRFYDKHQVIVYENGRSCFLGEHSCMDGTPTLRMNEFVLGTLASGRADLGPPTVSNPSSLPAPEQLNFQLDSTVKQLITKSTQNFDTLVSKHDLHVLHYEGYGKNLMKHFKFSPDAWVQLVKQLAFHKMFGRPGVTYESAQTRKYQLGRTEVIRSASNESKAWAEAMMDPHAWSDPIHLRDLFRKAVSRHIQYSTWATDGQGVDRHLFGLKKLLKQGEELPEFYKDEAFSKSSHWELSTSQLSSRYFDGWGYGEVVEDGYGLSYSIGDEYVRWTITSLKRRTGELKHYLAEAATEVREMLEAAERKEKGKEGKGKL